MRDANSCAAARASSPAGRAAAEGGGDRDSTASGALPRCKTRSAGPKATAPFKSPGAPPSLAVAAPEPPAPPRRPGERWRPAPNRGQPRSPQPREAAGPGGSALPTAPPAPHPRCHRPPRLRTLRRAARRRTHLRPGPRTGPAPAARLFRTQQLTRCHQKQHQKKKKKGNSKKKRKKKKKRQTAQQHGALEIGSVRHRVQLCRAAETGFWYLTHPMRSPRSLPR
ncbi:translation initiation factor IF-2-like isoform X2 [Corvus kubaryi]|nr:translation initiation factor IF-2-like isoform X2 [Corvus kubaryi]